MPSISLKDIQNAINDSVGISTYNGNEETNNECDIHSLLSEGKILCSEYY